MIVSMRHCAEWRRCKVTVKVLRNCYCGIGCLMCFRSEVELQTRGHACGCVFCVYKTKVPVPTLPWEEQPKCR